MPSWFKVEEGVFIVWGETSRFLNLSNRFRQKVSQPKLNRVCSRKIRRGNRLGRNHSRKPLSAYEAELGRNSVVKPAEPDPQPESFRPAGVYRNLTESAFWTALRYTPGKTGCSRNGSGCGIGSAEFPAETAEDKKHLFQPQTNSLSFFVWWIYGGRMCIRYG